MKFSGPNIVLGPQNSMFEDWGCDVTYCSDV